MLIYRVVGNVNNRSETETTSGNDCTVTIKQKQLNSYCLRC